MTGKVYGQVAEAKEPVRLTLWLHDYTREAAMLVGDVRAAADGAFEFRDVPWLAGFLWGFKFYVLLARQGDRGTFRIRVAPGSNYIYLRPGEGFEEVGTGNYALDVVAGEEKQVEFRVRGRARDAGPK